MATQKDNCRIAAEQAIIEKYGRNALDPEGLKEMHAEAMALLDSQTPPEDVVAGMKEKSKRNALIAKRNTAINAIRVAKIMGDIERKMDIKSNSNLIADVLDGPNSVGSIRDSESRYLKGFIEKRLNDYKKLNGDNSVSNGLLKAKFDEDVFNDIWALDGIGTMSNNKTANQIATILSEFEDLSRQRLNSVGAHIPKRPGHALGQHHEAYKLRKNAGSWDVWWNDIKEGLNYEQTFGVTRNEYDTSALVREMVEERVRRWYTSLSQSNHLSYSRNSSGGNVAKSVSAERKIIFKDGRSAMAYQKKYGRNTIADMMGSSFGASSRAYALMAKLGPNYQDNLDEVLARTVDIARARAVKSPGKGWETVVGKLGNNARNKLEAKLSNLDGTLNIPGSEWFGAAGSWVRSSQGWAHLGSAVLSMVPDPVNQMMNANLQGQGLMESVGNYFRVLLNGIPKEDQNAIISAMHAAVSEDRLSIMGDLSPDEFGKGYVGKINQFFGKVSLIEQVSDKQRKTTNVMNAVYIGEKSKESWEQLTPRTRAVLQEVEINEPQWEAIRQGYQDLELSKGNYRVLSETAIGEMDESIVSDYLGKMGRESSPFHITEARRELSEALRAYYIVNEQSGTIEANARTRSMMLQGTQAGTATGELWRSFGQFKGFPMAVISQRIVRDFRLRHAAGESLGAYASLGIYIGGTTLGGLGAMTLKAWRDGREMPEYSTELMIAGMLQGGGLGLYGDMLFGNMRNRFGGSSLASLFGPTVGVAASVMDVINRATNTAVKGEDLGALDSAFRLIKNNVPFGNIFYMQPILDAHIWDEIAGFDKVSRYRQAKKREMGVDYFTDIGESSYEAAFRRLGE